MLKGQDARLRGSEEVQQAPQTQWFIFKAEYLHFEQERAVLLFIFTSDRHLVNYDIKGQLFPLTKTERLCGVKVSTDGPLGL